ncbi:MAG TPA: cytochrome b/b6 domain-containing protein [Bryobacteraceae bacterium]|nr:cytochrome b/b6 domain-containing protein [Bryobacteraceae bacterium]
MGLVTWARSPWGQDVPIHIAWFLIYVAAIAGLGFLIVHAIWIRYFAKHEEFAGAPSAAAAANVPTRVARHSFAARAFHWIMAASMLTLLVTAFLPKVGVQFDWVPIHWIAGLVLTASILFHIIHATFVMDFWAIWPDKADIEDANRRLKRFMGQDAPPPRRFAKYPLENKMYHMAILVTGLAVMLTGIFMIFRVRTGIFPRNPYLFGDMTWGLMYVLHGLAGVGLIALIMIHIYFAIRPEKFVITKSMVFGSMPKEYYLSHHDPERWVVVESSSSKGASA